MCLILFAWQDSRVKAQTGHSLIVAANRDEFYNRPAAPAHFWKDAPQILAGKDLQAGGTWLGISTDGKFAALTNWREPLEPQSTGYRSRGELIKTFLDQTGTVNLDEYAQAIESSFDEFRGFSLLLSNQEQLILLSNRGPIRSQILEPGMYSLSNASLDATWPKNVRGKKLFSKAVQNSVFSDESLFEVLKDSHIAEDDELPETGLPKDREQALSPIFIQAGDYGTRCSTVVCRNHQQITLAERTFNQSTSDVETQRFKLEL